MSADPVYMKIVWCKCERANTLNIVADKVDPPVSCSEAIEEQVQPIYDKINQIQVIVLIKLHLNS